MSKQKKKIKSIEKINTKELIGKNDEFLFPLLNKVFFSVGLVSLIMGFLLLARVNPDATNLPAIFSPIFILSGILVIVISLLIKGE